MVFVAFQMPWFSSIQNYLLGWGLGLGLGCWIPPATVCMLIGERKREELRLIKDEEWRNFEARRDQRLRKEGYNAAYDEAYQKGKEDATAMLCSVKLT